MSPKQLYKAVYVGCLSEPIQTSLEGGDDAGACRAAPRSEASRVNVAGIGDLEQLVKMEKK